MNKVTDLVLQSWISQLFMIKELTWVFLQVVFDSNFFTTTRQTEEMEEKVRLLNTSTTEEEINELATQQFEQQALVAGRWGSQLDALRQTQRAQHRAWLMTTLEEYQSTSALNTPR